MSKIFQPLIGLTLTIVGFAVGNPALVRAGFQILTMAALSIISQALAGKPEVKHLGIDIEYSGTVEQRRIIYGQVKVSGMNVIPPWTSGPGNQALHQVIALAGHEVNDIKDVYFGQTTIASAHIGAVVGNANDGAVSSGTYANKAWIRRYKGTSTQGVDYILDTAFTDWTSNHRGRGIAYLALKFLLDQTVYSSGKPEITCLVQGKKCYDPRLDVTPGASPRNVNYIAYTTNPALCLTDYLLDNIVGVGESASRIDWSLVVAAANICDENVVIPPAASPSNKQKRYTCNVVLEAAATDAERRENIKVLVGAMMGSMAYRGGMWRMYAGAATTPNFALTEDDLVGNISIRTEMPANQKYNYVRGQFVDAARNYQLAEFEPRSNAGYEIEDGDATTSPIVTTRLPREVTFPCCINQYEAQRNALIVLKRSRRKHEVTGVFGMSAFLIRPWDVGTLTVAELGWNAQPVRCTSWSFNPNGTISATFLEELASDWNDPAVSDYTEPGASGGPAATPYTPEAPSNLRTVGLQNAILIQFDRPTAVLAGAGFEVRESTASTMTSPTTVYSGNDIQVVLQKSVVTTYYYQVRTSYFGQYSEWVPTSAGVSGKAGSLVGVLGASVAPSTATSSTGSSSQTTNSVTVTASAGTPSYTYAWTWASGGSGITIDSNSAATTTFSATGLAEGETRSGQARCTVTDSASPHATATADVTVSIARVGATIGATIHLYESSSAPDDCTTAFRIDNDGHIYTGPGPSTDQGLWCDPVDYAANYEVRVERTGGSASVFTSGPALDTWHATTADREWRLTRTANFGTSDIVFTIKFRKSSGSSPQAIVSTTTLNNLECTVVPQDP